MFLLLQKILPQKFLSRLIGILSECEIELVKNLFIKLFMKLYSINMSEAELENPFLYKNFNVFFTRSLKISSRPINKENNSIISPCDGTIYQAGKITNDALLNVKGDYFNIQNLIGKEITSNIFTNGTFINIYLSPKDYHRVHMPIAGTLKQMIYVPGKLFSVNNKTANAIPDLFSLNERIVNVFETDFGTMIVVLVGALFVGNIKTSWQGIINPSHNEQYSVTTYKEKEIKFHKGQEMGLFQMGSTVIVLLENQDLILEQYLNHNASVLMGQKLGSFI